MNETFMEVDGMEMEFALSETKGESRQALHNGNISWRIFQSLHWIRQHKVSNFIEKKFVRRVREELASDRGDVPGWVLVVLMTTGLITAIWTIAAPRLSTILTHSLDSMNSIR